jgi:hypothetical protein
LRKTLAAGKWGHEEGERDPYNWGGWKGAGPNQNDPGDDGTDRSHWLPYSKTPWSPGLHAIDPHREQQASLQRREPGALLRAADQRQAAVQKHSVSGEASLKIALSSGLKPVGGVKSSGNLFKQIQLVRASPLPLASTTG